jgi:hypothetical protein
MIAALGSMTDILKNACRNALNAFLQSTRGYGIGRKTLLLLMTVATQALLALVSSNLMTFPFLSARHNLFVLK